MRSKGAIIFIFVIFLISPMVITPSPTMSPQNVRVETYQLAEADVDRMFSDVDLLSEPDYQISGDSGEFSYFHSAHYDDDDGVSMMQWDHVAGTQVSSDDGVYFEKSFDWSISEYPRSMHIFSEYAFDFSGDFVYDHPIVRYGVIKFWLTSPSGSMHSLGYHYSTNGYVYRNYTIDCSGFVDDIWYELVADPSIYSDTTFTLRVGLFPGDIFLSGEPGDEPWNVTTGSMILLIKNLDLVLTEGTPSDSEEVANPIYENSWETTLANKQDYALNSDVADTFQGLVSLDDGTFVSLMSSFSGPVFHDMVLVHWGPEANVLSSNRVVDCVPAAITSDGQDLYVTGDKDGNVFMSKWTVGGQLLWNNTWDLGMDDKGKCLVVDSEGSVYLYVTRYNATTWNFADGYLFKFDEEGNEDWNIYLNDTWISEMYSGNRSAFFTLDNNQLKEWDSDGNVLSTIAGVNSFRVDSEELITLSASIFPQSGLPYERGSLLTLSRIDANGDAVWSTNLSISYYPDFKELIAVRDFEITYDGYILLLLELREFAREYRLYRYFANGTLDGYKLVGWTLKGGDWDSYDMVVGRNGLVFLSTREYIPYGTNSVDTIYEIEAYNYTSYTPPLIPVQYIPFVYAGVGIVAVVAVVLLYRRRRTQPL